MKTLPHEIERYMLVGGVKNQKYACVDLGVWPLKAIVNRKSGNIKVIFSHVCNEYITRLYNIYEVENAFREKFIVCFDEKGNMRVSEQIDKVHYCLENFVICEKQGIRYLIPLYKNYKNLTLKTANEVFTNNSKDFVLLLDIKSTLSIVNTTTLEKVGPLGISTITLLRGKNWLNAGCLDNTYIIIRTSDFKYSDNFQKVTGYRYSYLGSTVSSDDYVIVTHENQDYLYSIKDMRIIINRGISKIVAIDEHNARVKFIDSDNWYEVNLKTGLLY